MNDAAAIISTCRRLLSNLQTLPETDARAAVAVCDAWLKENHLPNQRQNGALKLVARSRLPSEILNAILRKIPYDRKKTALLACSSVNREWRRHAWPQVWKRFSTNKEVAVIVRHFSLPWARKAVEGIQVRRLEFLRQARSFDDLALLLATPVFSGIRVLRFHNLDVIGPLQLLVTFYTLPNLISLACDYAQNLWVEGGLDLRLGEKEENEVWRRGLGNLKALNIRIRLDHGSEIVLEKLAMGLGAQLKSLRLRLNAATERGGKGFTQFLRNLSENCPHLVDLSFAVILNEKATEALQLFINTQQQLVHLTLSTNMISDDLIRTIAASCPSLKFLHFFTGYNVTRRCFQHLATGPFLRALRIQRTPGVPSIAIAEKDIVDFLSRRGKYLEYFEFPNEQNCALAPFIEFLPNIRYFDTGRPWARYQNEDVIAFLHGAQKLEHLWIGKREEMAKEICDVACARKVELSGPIPFPSYVELKEEGWLGSRRRSRRGFGCGGLGSSSERMAGKKCKKLAMIVEPIPKPSLDFWIEGPLLFSNDRTVLLHFLPPNKNAQ
ncbi:hypothetical protein HK104_006171 [Borealophlyctis nickersoniae]|nr:hypothetical protein HK104_006171 [Borealophlyctis nickersoniae]